MYEEIHSTKYTVTEMKKDVPRLESRVDGYLLKHAWLGVWEQRGNCMRWPLRLVAAQTQKLSGHAPARLREYSLSLLQHLLNKAVKGRLLYRHYLSRLMLELGEFLGGA